MLLPYTVDKLCDLYSSLIFIRSFFGTILGNSKPQRKLRRRRKVFGAGINVLYIYGIKVDNRPQDKADSFFTTQRLNYISNRTRSLRPRVGELRDVDAEGVTASVQQLESQAKALLRSVRPTSFTKLCNYRPF